MHLNLDNKVILVTGESQMIDAHLSMELTHS